jgi:cGMP-dependent protein kinase
LICTCETEVFQKLIGGSFKEVYEKLTLVEWLQKIPLFRNFAITKLEKVSRKINVEKFEKGEKIIVQGETSYKFYIVKKGKIDITVNSNYIRTLNECEYFGDRALFFNEPRSATATANGNVEVYVLEKEDFKSILENNLKDYLLNRYFLQDNTVELSDLEYLRELGSGNFGAVNLVYNKKNKFLYAIKAISKKQIDMEVLHKNLDLERSILLQIDHPFIVKLVKTLKDDKFVYFLMEYIRGKELFDVIRIIGLLNNSQTRFYGCSLMLAVEYLHERKFIYRDVKPENVMVTDTVLFS